MIGTNELGWDEAYAFISGLLRTTDSLLYSAYNKVPRVSSDGMLLIALQHSIIETIPRKKSDNKAIQSMKIPFPQPESEKPKRTRPIKTREQAEKFFAYSRIKKE